MKNSYQLYPKLRIDGAPRIIEEIYIAPLGHLMVKFFNEEKKNFSYLQFRFMGRCPLTCYGK